MPNWCANVLEVVGPEDKLTEFKNKARGKNSPLSFYSLKPYPDEWDYNWCNDNWGTKWDIDDSDTEEIKNESDDWILRFHTAWAPPIPLLETVSKQFPDLGFRVIYAEPGMDFSGSQTWTNNNSEEGLEFSLPESNTLMISEFIFSL